MISAVKIIIYIDTITITIIVSSQFQCNFNIFVTNNMIICEKNVIVSFAFE